MKAWKVVCGDEWMALIHAETRGKAIANTRNWVDAGESFIDFRAYRFREMDDKAFNLEILRDFFDNDEESDSDYSNDCLCEICIAERAKERERWH